MASSILYHNLCNCVNEIFVNSDLARLNVQTGAARISLIQRAALFILNLWMRGSGANYSKWMSKQLPQTIISHSFNM